MNRKIRSINKVISLSIFFFFILNLLNGDIYDLGASGLTVLEIQQEIVANNMATKTPGFKGTIGAIERTYTNDDTLGTIQIKGKKSFALGKNWHGKSNKMP